MGLVRNSEVFEIHVAERRLSGTRGSQRLGNVAATDLSRVRIISRALAMLSLEQSMSRRWSNENGRVFFGSGAKIEKTQNFNRSGEIARNGLLAGLKWQEAIFGWFGDGQIISGSSCLLPQALLKHFIHLYVSDF